MALKELLLSNPYSGVSIRHSCFKIRLAIKSKGKGKSGGARIITHVVMLYTQSGIIYLLAAYDKSDTDSISDSLIKELMGEIK